MAYSNIDIRTWSMLGQRGTFGVSLEKLGHENEDVIALTADLCNTSGMDRFATSFPERFINVGIAEQNLVGVAAGIADAGKIPFATTFANFASLRACEMVRHFMGYMKCNVKLVGLSAGYGMEFFGNTHYAIEDIATLRSIPNIVIFSPADGMEVVKCVEAAAEIKVPVYIRLTGIMNQPIVHRQDFEFIVGKSLLLKEGTDVLILATGSMVECAIKVAKLLDEDNISASVVDIHTIKPFDEEVLKDLTGKKLVVTVEEHSVIGGLGSIVAESLAKKGKSIPLLPLGVQQGYIKAGDYKYMLEQQGLTAPKIKENILKALQGE